jgi:hypothetical protein
MPHSMLWTCAIAALMVSGVDASAQTCRGRGAIGAQSPLQVGVEVLAGPRQVFPPPLGGLTDSIALLGSVAGGTDSWFGGGQVGQVDYQESDSSSTLAGLVAGAQFPVVRSRRMMICPAVVLDNEFGPKQLEPGWKTSTLALSGRLSVGLIAMTSGSVQVVPTFGLTVLRTNMKVEYPTRDVSVYRFSVSDTTAQVDLGVGVVGRRFGITPVWTIPLAESHESVVGVVRGVRYLRSTFRLALVVNLF